CNDNHSNRANRSFEQAVFQRFGGSDCMRSTAHPDTFSYGIINPERFINNGTKKHSPNSGNDDKNCRQCSHSPNRFCNSHCDWGCHRFWRQRKDKYLLKSHHFRKDYPCRYADNSSNKRSSENWSYKLSQHIALLIKWIGKCYNGWA